jgi:nitrite reductase/ring-hydroxylating ferredoxin subunit
MTFNPPDRCAGCGKSTPDTTSRRGFLRCAGAIISVTASGLGDVFAAGLPVSIGAPGAASGSERRYPVPAADGVTIDRKNQLILVRYQQHLYAFNLACPHENTALKWLPKDQRFQCPKHDSKYQPNGTFIGGRATRHMDRLGIRLEDDALVVDVNKFYQSDKDPAGWTAATVSL